MERITADSEIEEVMARIGVGEGEELRESEKRRRNLEKFAQLRSRKPETSLSFKKQHTATVEVDGLDDLLDDDENILDINDVDEVGEFQNIIITTREYEQKVTDLPRRYFDYLIQKGLTVHEVGHILYSSAPGMLRYVQKVEDESGHTRARMFHHFWNAAEDGAIERYLARDYRVGEELQAVRSSVHEDAYCGEERRGRQDDSVYSYTAFMAVKAAMICEGIYDNGELDKLLDPDNDKFFLAGELEKKRFRREIVPAIQNYIPQIHQATDAEDRARLTHELWEIIDEFLDQAMIPGDKEFKRQQDNQEYDSYFPGVPSNMGEGHGGQQQDPSGGSPVPSDSSVGEARKKEMDALADSQDGEPSQLEQEGREGVINESKQQGVDWSDELETVIKSLQGGAGVDEIFIGEAGDADKQRIREAQNFGMRAEQRFRSRLQRHRRKKVQRNQRRGKFDTRKMINAERGSTRTFTRTEEGDEKDYSCIIVADRSGSMSNDVEEVELAIGAIGYGLEANGVDVSVLDTYDSKTRLSKPFQTSMDSFDDHIFTGDIGGGTPISHTVRFARDRVSEGAGEVPFIVVITDGAPHNETQFKEEVQKCTFPVLGLFLARSRDAVDDQLDRFNRGVVCAEDDDIQQKIIELINQVVF